MSDTGTLSNTMAVRAWLRTCPEVIKANAFRVDYLEEQGVSYALYSVPSAIRYRENILGEMVMLDEQTQNFVFAAKEHYGADIQQNLKNLAFFERVVAWIYEQNAALNFPEWEGGEVKSVVATLTGYPVRAGAEAAKYQIQIQIKYRRT